MHYKKHRITLYTFVVLLAILQIISFTVLSIQVSRLNSLIDSGLKGTKQELREFTTNLVGVYDKLYQENFKGISKLLTKQQEDFKQEVSLLKSGQQDFSTIVRDDVKSIVTVSAGGSIGTGFVVHPLGYLVTNYHVISNNQDNVQIIDFNRSIISATFVGKDETRDLALLKIEGDYVSLKLANSDELQAGNKVIAIGNPLGLTYTVTEGIISAIDREGPNGLAEYIQTDVSLNPGNSGGPLIDTQGKVVGINNFKIGGAESLGFALESNAIKESVNAILNQSLL